MGKTWAETVICEECGLTLDKAKYVPGKPLSIYYNGKQCCLSCYSGVDTLAIRIKRKLHSKQMDSKTENHLLDKIRSPEDGKTLISRTTGREWHY